MNRDEKIAKMKALRDEADALLKEISEEDRQRDLQRPLLERMIFAASARCPCGAGLAYDPVGPSGSVQLPDGGYWDCSAILLGTAIPKDQPGSVQHTGKLPFVFYGIKSEGQPSAYGATTRPTA